MPHRSTPGRRLAPPGKGLTADLVGIGLLVGGEASDDPDIEEALLRASKEGMLRGDLRVLAVLVTGFGVHSGRVDAGKLSRLVAAQRPTRGPGTVTTVTSGPTGTPGRPILRSSQLEYRTPPGRVLRTRRG